MRKSEVSACWIDPLVDLSRVRDIWESLAVACQASYFLSWPWVENWLSTLPPATDLRLLVMVSGQTPLAACFVGRRTMIRNRVVPSRALFLNATGWPEFDEICVEHNAWLARSPVALSALVNSIPGDWDELFLNAMDGLPSGQASLPDWPTRIRLRERRPCYVVDLEKVRGAKGQDYLSLLAGELRSQIKRSYKLYQARGPITVEVATGSESAGAFFEEMVRLHQATWKARGQPGAFSVAYMRRFHERLIDSRLAHGDIQMMRVRAGDATLGCLYNFVWDGTVSFYQSGVAYESDNRLKPGLVCHAEAIRHNAAAGAKLYDFLAGDARYKRGLSTDVREMVWATVQRPRLRFLAEDCARMFLGAWRQHQEATAGRGRAGAAPAPDPGVAGEGERVESGITGRR